MPRILLREVHQLALRPTLGHEQSGSAVERLGHERQVLEVERQEYLARPRRGLPIVRRQILREHLAVRDVLDPGQIAVLTRDELAVADAEPRHRGVLAVPRVPDHITVPTLHGQDHRRLPELREPREGVAVLRRALVVHGRRGRRHPLRDACLDGGRLPVEAGHHLLQVGAIRRDRLPADARRAATPDVVVEAGALRCLARQVVAAGAHLEDALDDLERAAHPLHIGVGPEVARPVRLEPPSHEHARQRLLHRHLHVRVRFVVPEQDVEPRAMLLDQVRLEDQRVHLGRHDDRLDVGDQAHEAPGLRTLVV